MSLLSKSRKAQKEIQKQNCISINEKVVQFAILGKALIKVRHEGIDPSHGARGRDAWNKFVSSIEVLERDDCNEILSYRRGCVNH